MNSHMDFIKEQLYALTGIPSPSGFTKKVTYPESFYQSRYRNGKTQPRDLGKREKDHSVP